MKHHDRRAEVLKAGLMSFAEIGQELGITRGAARMLYKRAMRKLRRYRHRFETLRQLAAGKEQ